MGMFASRYRIMDIPEKPVIGNSAWTAKLYMAAAIRMLPSISQRSCMVNFLFIGISNLPLLWHKRKIVISFRSMEQKWIFHTRACPKIHSRNLHALVYKNWCVGIWKEDALHALFFTGTFFCCILRILATVQNVQFLWGYWIVANCLINGEYKNGRSKKN